MNIRSPFFGLGFFVLLVSAPGCDQTDPVTTTARITEDGVDGVEFGHTIIDIRRILGDPNGFSDLDGPLGSWYGLGFDQGDHAGLDVYVTHPDTLAPVDLFAIRAPFVGKTAEGIGIGSTPADVFDAFGPPADSIVVELTNGSIIRSYYLCMGIRDLEVIIDADTVSAFFYGYNEPLAGWRTECQE